MANVQVLWENEPPRRPPKSGTVKSHLLGQSPEIKHPAKEVHSPHPLSFLHTSYHTGSRQTVLKQKMSKSAKDDWRRVMEESIKEAKLEALLFTGLQDSESRYGNEYGGAHGEEGDSSSDDTGDGILGLTEDRQGRRENLEGDGEVAERRPAWDDEDDNAMMISTSSIGNLKKDADGQAITGNEYEDRLRQMHRKLNARVSWATVKTKDKKGRPKRRKLNDASSSDDEDDSQMLDSGSDFEDAAERLLSSAGGLLGKQKALQPQRIELSKLKDANMFERHKGVVSSVQFHLEGQLLLTAGRDKRMNLFQVDGVHNPKAQGVVLQNFPIHNAAFSRDGQQIVAASSPERKFFYLFDINTAKTTKMPFKRSSDGHSKFCMSPSLDSPLVAFYGVGNVGLWSPKSHQWVGDLITNAGVVTSAVFSPDGMEIYTAGSGGRVNVWDIRTRRCMHQFIDEGTLHCTAMAMAPSGQYMAAGSEMGVANVYDTKECRPSDADSLLVAPKPLKSLMNLTTVITTLEFSPDAQVLAMASSDTKDAVRLVHLPSCTVYENWPSAPRDDMHKVRSMAFSPGGGFLAVGNECGRVLLYRLHYYPQV